jgi:hypothetical protein
MGIILVSTIDFILYLKSTTILLCLFSTILWGYCSISKRNIVHIALFSFSVSAFLYTLLTFFWVISLDAHFIWSDILILHSLIILSIFAVRIIKGKAWTPR